MLLDNTTSLLGHACKYYLSVIVTYSGSHLLVATRSLIYILTLRLFLIHFFFMAFFFFLNFFILMFANAVMGLSWDVPHIYIGVFISGHFI